MMSEGELKLILVQIKHELIYLEKRLTGTAKRCSKSRNLYAMERLKLMDPVIYLRLRKYIELQDKEKALEADWLAQTGTEWR